MSELLERNPGHRETLLTEKSELTLRLSELALRQAMFVRMMAESDDLDRRSVLVLFMEETEEESERAADRVGAINQYLGEE